MNKKVVKVVEKIRLKYNNIDTILLFGSARLDKWTSESDIDIFLIDNKLQDSREDLDIDGVNIEIQKDNFDNLTKDIKNERGRLLNRNVSTMIEESEIITTRSEDRLLQIKSLATDTLKSTPKYTDEDVKMWRYSIQDYTDKAEKDLARGDTVAFYFDANYVIQNATELFLATHNLYLPQPKHLAELLQTNDSAFYNILHDFISCSDLSDKLKILQKLKSL